MHWSCRRTHRHMSSKGRGLPIRLHVQRLLAHRVAMRRAGAHHSERLHGRRRERTRIMLRRAHTIIRGRRRVAGEVQASCRRPGHDHAWMRPHRHRDELRRPRRTPPLLRRRRPSLLRRWAGRRWRRWAGRRAWAGARLRRGGSRRWGGVGKLANPVRKRSGSGGQSGERRGATARVCAGQRGGEWRGGVAVGSGDRRAGGDGRGGGRRTAHFQLHAVHGALETTFERLSSDERVVERLPRGPAIGGGPLQKALTEVQHRLTPRFLSCQLGLCAGQLVRRVLHDQLAQCLIFEVLLVAAWRAFEFRRVVRF
mmetsp:Transcript_15638/g.39225  ORF Transcript_15638/g.39225 Transcript_15638/m.39225 type:complete len:311 (-) Transcript_15638:1213-2145(-)